MTVKGSADLAFYEDCAAEIGVSEELAFISAGCAVVIYAFEHNDKRSALTRERIRTFFKENTSFRKVLSFSGLYIVPLKTIRMRILLKCSRFLIFMNKRSLFSIIRFFTILSVS